MRPNFDLIQHPYKGHEQIFSSQNFPGSPVPSFTMEVAVKYCMAHYRDFRLVITLRNTVKLSVIREKGRGYLEVAQLIRSKITTIDPCFDADEYGIKCIKPFDLLTFVEGLVMQDLYGLDYVEGS